MSIKSILVPFTSESELPEVRMALAIAKDLDAHVDGLCIELPKAPPPMHPVTRGPAMAGLGAGSFSAASASTIASDAQAASDAAESTRSRSAGAAKARFEQLCDQYGVRVLEPGSADAGNDHPLPSASCRRETGQVAEIVSRHACTHDMMVTECTSREAKQARTAVEATLLRAGRPVLLAPAHPSEHLQGRVLVAWNDSPQCWRALSTAMPFISKAKEVVLFYAGNDRSQRQAEERAAEYLAWHGIEAEVAQHEPGQGSVADCLMSQCSERGVDLMVMGAYSHSPLRERILGGVTLSVLSNAADTPVLMMH